jgi:ribosomal protein S18 acetylase RimI-like enzyme
VAASLRKFAAGDREAVLELSRHALARPELHVGNPVWMTRDEMESELADWDPPPEQTLCVAEDVGRVVGFGGIELPRGFDHAELFGPLIASEAQGQRLGTELLLRSIEHAREGKATAVLAAIGTRNPAGQILLESHGFRPRGRAQATFRLRPADHRPYEGREDDVVVRLAGQEDFEAAIRLYKECFPEGRFPATVWRNNIDEGTVYAAEEEGRLVAVLNIDPADRWIYHMGVTESERNRGVGSYLLSRSLEDYWRRHPGEVLGLDVEASNVPAIRLYRRQGFAPWLVLQTFELPL